MPGQRDQAGEVLAFWFGETVSIRSKAESFACVGKRRIR
jgi:hypothetical protein